MQRPTPVTIFGILNIIFGVLGILSIFGMLALFAIIGSDSDNPVIQAMQTNPAIQVMKNPSYAAYFKFSMVLGLAACVVLLISGIGLLKFKPWARMLCIIYGVYGIISVIGSSIANYYFLIQPMLQKAATEQGPDAAGAMGGITGGTYGSCIGIIYPVCLLYFMTRPNVIAAFNSSSTDGTPPPLPRA
jgi:hypothetical protein